MHFEVERKFRILDPAAGLAGLKAREVLLGEAELQVDCYYAHPARDFAQTDEALRIRRVGRANFVTYKGPKLDPASKTRRELELPLAEGDAGAAGFADLLMALGFRPVAEVRKRRRKGHVAWQGRSVELAWDEVEELGSFVELELLAGPEDLEAAQASVALLARELDLSGDERRSYLELLLAARAAK